MTSTACKIARYVSLPRLPTPPGRLLPSACPDTASGVARRFPLSVVLVLPVLALIRGQALGIIALQMHFQGGVLPAALATGLLASIGGHSRRNKLFESQVSEKDTNINTSPTPTLCRRNTYRFLSSRCRG